MRFSHCYKLKTQEDFKQVFHCGKKSGSKEFLFISVKNTRQVPRLGLAISKKHIRLASSRNRVKRLIRESFRENIASLPNIDIVVLAKSSINPTDTRLYSKLNQQWKYLAK